MKRFYLLLASLFCVLALANNFYGGSWHLLMLAAFLHVCMAQVEK